MTGWEEIRHCSPAVRMLLAAAVVAAVVFVAGAMSLSEIFT